MGCDCLKTALDNVALPASHLPLLGLRVADALLYLGSHPQGDLRWARLRFFLRSCHDLSYLLWIYNESTTFFVNSQAQSLQFLCFFSMRLSSCFRMVFYDIYQDILKKFSIDSREFRKRTGIKEHVIRDWRLKGILRPSQTTIDAIENSMGIEFIYSDSDISGFRHASEHPPSFIEMLSRVPVDFPPSARVAAKLSESEWSMLPDQRRREIESQWEVLLLEIEEIQLEAKRRIEQKLIRFKIGVKKIDQLAELEEPER